MLYQGELLIADTPSAVKGQIKGTVLELRLENHQRGMKILEGIESFRNLLLSGDKIHILVDDFQKGEKVIMDVLKREDLKILSLGVVRPSLEDAFVSMVREKQKKATS
jgi:ABC-2 type transport system ATP-binding protein